MFPMSNRKTGRKIAHTSSATMERNRMSRAKTRNVPCQQQKLEWQVLQLLDL
jgi:hypothetical protein